MLEYAGSINEPKQSFKTSWFMVSIPLVTFHYTGWIRIRRTAKNQLRSWNWWGLEIEKAMLYRVKPCNFGKSQLILKVVTVLFCFFNLPSLRKILLISKGQEAKRQSKTERCTTTLPVECLGSFRLGGFAKSIVDLLCKREPMALVPRIKHHATKNNKSLRCRIGFQLNSWCLEKLGGINETTRRVAHLLVASFSTGCY